MRSRFFVRGGGDAKSKSRRAIRDEGTSRLSYPVAALVVLMEFIKIRVKSAAGLVKPLSRERVFAALDTSRERRSSANIAHR